MSFRPLFPAVATSLVAAAGLGLAWMSGPALALDSGFSDPLELAQATPPAVTPPPPAAGGAERADRQAFNPKAFCLDRIARRAGNRAYLKVRLDLKPDQMTAWNAFTKASDEADIKDTQRCNALPTEMKERPSYIDRLTMEETFMKGRIERIDAVKPSLVAFYNTLSPEQKAVLDSPRPMGGMMGRHGHGRHGPR
jgi:hypothetical protein